MRRSAEGWHLAKCLLLRCFHSASSRSTLQAASLAPQSLNPSRCNYSSSVAKLQEGDVSEVRWHELPPVPRQGRVGTSWDASKISQGKDEKQRNEEKTQQITALWWVAKCCPSLPHSLRQKLFRLRQVRKRPSLGTSSEAEKQDFPSNSLSLKQLEPRLRRVSAKAVLEDGSVLCLPKSVFVDVHNQRDNKTQHDPSAEEVAWLQSLVLYKDSEILVVNKPPGLPVQGGSDIKQSLDSLMGTALSFEYEDGPKLVHRLDKETSGIMLLARTQESTLLLHSLFRKKTAAATETKKVNIGIDRVYWALVIGTPKQSQGQISVPLIKLVLDKGKADKIMIAHDFSSENSQLAITDYRVVGPSHLGCTWLELHPLTGRKHQLRVHCAEVLGTPVLGDSKYGWQTQKEWLKYWKSQDMNSLGSEGAVEGTSTMKPEELQQMNNAKGSILSEVPLLHLHCRQMALPNVKQRLDTEKDTNFLKFVAPLPAHMAASKNLWARKFPNIFSAER